MSRRKPHRDPPPEPAPGDPLSDACDRWHFGPLVCRGCGAQLGESIPYRQGVGYRPLVKMARGLVRLTPEPGTGRTRFGRPRFALRAGARGDPLRDAPPWPRRLLAPARPPARFPRKAAQNAAYGRGSEAREDTVPVAVARTWETAFVVNCPNCGRRNSVDLDRGVLQ
jgi:hypothetical protein